MLSGESLLLCLSLPGIFCIPIYVTKLRIYFLNEYVYSSFSYIIIFFFCKVLSGVGKIVVLIKKRAINYCSN